MFWSCHTYYSFRYGALSPEDLWREARDKQVKKLVLTDINNTSGWVELQRICDENRKEYDLDFSVGIEFRRGGELLYTGLAQNNEGFQELNRFLSRHNLSEEELPDQAPELANAAFVYPLRAINALQLKENEYIGIRAHEVIRLSKSEYKKYIHRMVIWHPVTFANKKGYNIHRLLRAIDENTLLSKLEKSKEAHFSEFMVSELELKAPFWQYPQIVNNTKRLMEMCQFNISLGDNKNKSRFLASKAEDHDLLRERALEGFRQRYEKYSSYAMQRLLRELEVIADRDFEAYFLITLDIIDYARHRDFAHVGRGSGANSMVAYCLGITEVDPMELDLYFERFLNPYRSSPPDFDIDFSWTDRDEVQKYIIDKYSTEHAALLATYNTFQGRSVLRELAKVFGLPKDEIDRIVDYPVELREKDEITRLIFRYAEYIHDMPNNLSVHAGGLVITENPIYAFTATDLPPKGFPITHFDMYGAEDLGIYKFDILSQRGLGHIKDTVEIVEQNKGVKIDISKTSDFKKDERLNSLLKEGKAMGCFYIESPAMRMLLNKLKCDNYITLVAASSIIRPGVARSGMMREYIHRHHHPGQFDYIHPKMKELMEETYGIMVYQEDVIKVAHHFAGLDLGESDILRRGMSGKFRSRKEFKRVEKKFFQNCERRGYPSEISTEVWRQIESFSGYSFSKAHSASYAVESYQSLYLKTYHPLEFMVGVINNFGGYYKTEFYFHEARMSGARIEAPCVNTSEYLTRIDGDIIHIGFIHLKSLVTKIAKLIAIERRRNGPYTSLSNFIQRVSPGLEQTNILVKIGALRFTGKSKRNLLWETRLFFGQEKKVRQPAGLFDTPFREYKLPELQMHPLEDAFDEMELLGFPLCDPFLLLESSDHGDTRALELMKKLHRKVTIVGYLMTTKNTHTKNHKLMHFGTFIDDKGHVFDTTHFLNTALKHPFRGSGFYKLVGNVVEDFGYPMLEITYMEKLPIQKRNGEL